MTTKKTTTKKKISNKKPVSVGEEQIKDNISNNPLMTLNIAVPKYSLLLPVSQLKIRFRPFLVKEQKILLLALEGDIDENSNEIFNALRTVINSCTEMEIDCAKLPLTDLEFLFMHLRSKSVGEKLEVRIPDKDKDNEYFNYEINIEEVTVEIPDEGDSTITLSSGIIIQMAPPTLDRCEGVFYGSDSQIEQVFNVISACVETITSGEDVFQRKDMADGDIKEFIENMQHQDYELLANYFNSLPKLLYKKTIKSPLSGNMIDVSIENFTDFFV